MLKMILTKLKDLLEAGFGWQKEEIEWKNHLLVDDKEKRPVPFHYLPQEEVPEAVKTMSSSASESKEASGTRKRKPRKPKETKAVDSKTEKKVPAKTSTAKQKTKAPTPEPKKRGRKPKTVS